MWITKFKLKDNQDIYSELCKKLKIEFYAYPYSIYTKNNKINVIVAGTISGNNKQQFIKEIKKDKRVKKIEKHHDFILVHAQHPLTRESKAEIKIFYNPEYIQVKPIHVASDGWEYYELACLDRKELNKILKTARKHYNGKVFSIKEEKIKSITNFELMPKLTDKQEEAIVLAFKQGYYTYPRNLTLPELAKMKKKAYSTFQESLRKAEAKIIEHFLKYR
ncbi:MAG: helix-turn-helix domain-containing protein [Nanoarchaeota archaeon]|nr:helix-turn-helix domain-containing protein [Nanoarchaeota archaeon]